MISPGSATRVYLVLAATDMRKGYNGLHSLLCGYLKEDPLSGHLFVFSNRNRDRIKGKRMGNRIWQSSPHSGNVRWTPEFGPEVK